MGNFTIPSFSQGWAGLPAEVQTQMLWLISIIIAVFVIVAIIYTFGHGIMAMIKGKSGDASGKTSHVTDMLVGVVVIFFAFIFVAIILYLVS